MNTYHKVVCHDCKKQINLPHHTDSFIAEVVGDWATGDHICHSVSVLHDITGWDAEYDKLYDSTESYEEVGLPEGFE